MAESHPPSAQTFGFACFCGCAGCAWAEFAYFECLRSRVSFACRVCGTAERALSVRSCRYAGVRVTMS